MFYKAARFAERTLNQLITGKLMSFRICDVPVYGIVNILSELFNRPFPCRNLRQGKFHFCRSIRLRKGHVHIINELESEFCRYQFFFYLFHKRHLGLFIAADTLQFGNDGIAGCRRTDSFHFF